MGGGVDSGHQEALAEVQGVRASWGQGSGSPGRRACGPVDKQACLAGSLVSPSVEWGCAVPGAPGSGVGPVTASVFISCVTKSAVILALNRGPVLSTPSPADAWRLGLASPQEEPSPQTCGGPACHSSRRVASDCLPTLGPQGLQPAEAGTVPACLPGLLPWTTPAKAVSQVAPGWPG